MMKIINEILNNTTQILSFCTVGVLILEVFSGVYKAVKNKELNSTAFRTGLYGKVGYFIYIALAFLVSLLLNLPLVLQATLVFIIGSEGVSILENVAQAGIPIPSFLKDVLEKIKNNGDTGKGTDIK